MARRSPALAFLLVFALTSSAAGPDPWKFDVLRLKSGGTMTGLILEERGNDIRFQVIRQRPGEQTRITTTTTLNIAEIARFDRLSDRDRKVLRKRLEALDPDGKGERSRMEELTLMQVPWVQKDQQALCYASDHFILVSNANEEIVRRAAVRLEDIYAAYVRFLPPRRKQAKPTRIVLVRSVAEFQALLKGQGRNILNPAFYDAARNEILWGSDLDGERLAQVKQAHAEVLRQLKEQEEKYRKEYGKNVPAFLIKPILVQRQKIIDLNKRNEAAFEEATQRFFQVLYHEAFHAYLANFVYPPEEAEVPRWLNEGLAQIFETALIEAGELRVGHADEARLNGIRSAARDKKLLPLPELLQSGPKQFLVAHGGNQQVSDRHYLNSWALAYYLTFDRHLLGTAALDRYVQSLKRGTNEREAFRALTGKPLDQFEKDYRQYLGRLRSDGTLMAKPR